MKAILKWLGVKFIQGFFILLPVLLTYLMIGQLFDTLMALALPIVDLLPGRLFPDLWTQRLIAAVLLVLLFFIAALFAETIVGKRMGSWIESTLLNRFPPYVILRNLARRLSGTDVPAQLHPALMTVEPDTRMLVFIIEEHARGDLTVFVPLAPTPGVGTIQIVAATKVQRLDASMTDALGSVLNWGAGTEALIEKARTNERN